MDAVLVVMVSFLLDEARCAEQCKNAQDRCLAQLGCSMALHNYLMSCAELIHGSTDRCHPICQKAIVSLLSTQDQQGHNFITCDCQGNQYCQMQKRRVEICSNDVVAAMATIDDPEAIISCSLADLICSADTPCLTAMDYYKRHCGRLFRGEKCTSRCNNSLAILYRQSKALKLRTCQCDGTEQYDCRTVRENTERLCFSDSAHRQRSNIKNHKSRHRHLGTTDISPNEKFTPGSKKYVSGLAFCAVASYNIVIALVITVSLVVRLWMKQVDFPYSVLCRGLIVCSQSKPLVRKRHLALCDFERRLFSMGWISFLALGKQILISEVSWSIDVTVLLECLKYACLCSNWMLLLYDHLLAIHLPPTKGAQRNAMMVHAFIPHSECKSRLNEVCGIRVIYSSKFRAFVTWSNRIIHNTHQLSSPPRNFIPYNSSLTAQTFQLFIELLIIIILLQLPIVYRRIVQRLSVINISPLFPASCMPLIYQSHWCSNLYSYIVADRLNTLLRLFCLSRFPGKFIADSRHLSVERCFWMVY